MKTNLHALVLGVSFVMTVQLVSQTGPFDPADWPATVDPNKVVHYVVTDGSLWPPGGAWSDSLRILSGGDQVTEDTTMAGYPCKKVTGNYLNIADSLFEEWADDETIDILVQVYGNEALFNAQGQPRNFVFLTGVLPELNWPVGGQIPVEAKNKRWNWVLFRIENGIRPSDGSRYVGSIPANAQGGYQSGGVNGGTIRFESVPGLIVRVVAFGERGAFGEPEDINKFLPPEECDPEPETNLVGIDIAANVSNHLVVLNDGDQTVEYQADVGPAHDKRRAVRPLGMYLNFGITDNYLGKPCNDPRAIKVCVDFYDDPEFAGWNVKFGPEAYATDDVGGVGFYPADKRHLMAGTGKWIRRSWTVPAVNLKGVNVGTLTGGPRFISEGGQVFVSRVEMAVLRVGTHPLAGQDPLASCYEDPNICTDLYGNYVELDLAKGIRNGLDVGSSGGDQEMIIAEAGPADDRRLAVRAARDDGTPGFAHQYMNFAILNEALGPSSQPPAHLAICVTYYDDPALVGARFKPEVYQTERNGVNTLAFTPDSYFVTIEGTDKWRTAYWEISDMKFLGVNQGPQAAARFVVSDKVFFTRVRYAVIRPCGPMEGVNMIADCKPITDVELGVRVSGNKVEISWPASATDWTLQETPSLSEPAWSAVSIAPTVVGDRLVVEVPVEGTRFYRLTH